MVAALAKEKRDAASFGERLKALRLAAGMTQAELGKLMDMLPTNIARLETGGREPSWDTVKRLAKALNVSVESFVTDDE